MFWVYELGLGLGLRSWKVFNALNQLLIFPFCLFRSVNSLYHPEAKLHMFPSYVGALELHDFEKSAIFGTISIL